MEAEIQDNADKVSQPYSNKTHTINQLTTTNEEDFDYGNISS